MTYLILLVLPLGLDIVLASLHALYFLRLVHIALLYLLIPYIINTKMLVLNAIFALRIN